MKEARRDEVDGKDEAHEKKEQEEGGTQQKKGG